MGSGGSKPAYYIKGVHVLAAPLLQPHRGVHIDTSHHALMTQAVHGRSFGAAASALGRGRCPPGNRIC